MPQKANHVVVAIREPQPRATHTHTPGTAQLLRSHRTQPGGVLPGCRRARAEHSLPASDSPARPRSHHSHCPTAPRANPCPRDARCTTGCCTSSRRARAAAPLGRRSRCCSPWRADSSATAVRTAAAGNKWWTAPCRSARRPRGEPSRRASCTAAAPDPASAGNRQAAAGRPRGGAPTATPRPRRSGGTARGDPRYVSPYVQPCMHFVSKQHRT
jgi:hypothetical protein